MRWAFWRGRSSDGPAPERPLPGDVGLPTDPRSPAAPRDPDDSDDRPTPAWTSGASPATARPTYDPPPTTGTDVDRSTLAATGPELARLVSAPLGGAPHVDARTLAIAATGALAARLPALSGVDSAAAFDEPEDELLHAYADLLVARTQHRGTADRDDLLLVAHVAAAAVAVGAAAEPALLQLAGVPADGQLRAAVLLLAQTADDGGGAADRLADEVRELFGASG